MEKALKNKKLYTILSIVSAAVLVISLALAIIFILKEMYYPMIPFAVLSAAGAYCLVFFSFAAFDAKEATKMIPLVEELGFENVREIATRMGWRRVSTRKFLEKCKKHGYFA